MTDLRDAVRHRAKERCEYCHIPQAAFTRPFHIEHIVARQHGGPTEPDNLALACWQCNRKKGPNLTGIDPEGRNIVPLFDPRKDEWATHFDVHIGTLIANGIEIRGLTPIGRATARVLGMNDELRQMLRYELWREGMYEAGG